MRALSDDEGLERCGSCNGPLDPEVSFCTGCGAPRRTTDAGAVPGTAPVDELRERLERATEGEYQIVAPLGRGGMGSVFLALDESLHRHVAIKVMAPALIQDATMQERFRTEARIVATLRHPGIINIHGLRIVNDLYFFVMDYVEGATLRSIIRSAGPLPVDVVQAVLYDVGSALQHAHSRSGGVIHRDVKPSNVIIEPRGHAIVMDFGISKAANARSGLTMTGMVVGTPEYMSPEQCRGGQITASSDQYSLGLVGYAMLTGAPPFTGQHWSVLAKQTTEDPTPVRELRPDCPSEVADAIERMLSKSVRERFSDILTAVKALGGRPLEDASPTRVTIGELVDSVSVGRQASTPVVSVEIEGLPDTAETGEVVSISVTPLDGVGRALQDRRFVIESTDPRVLEVVGANTIRAVGEGTAMVLARCESVEVSRPLKVTASPVDSVAIAPIQTPVRCGDKVSMKAAVLDRSGEMLPGRLVVWASSDPAVADISRAGELAALSEGATTIFATSEGKSTTLDLQVLAADALLAAADRPSAATTVIVPASEIGGVDGPAAPVPEASRPRKREPARAPKPRPTRAEPAGERSAAPFLWFGGVLAAAAAAVFWVVPAFQSSAPGQPDPGPADPATPAALTAALEVTRDGQDAAGSLELLAGERVDLEVAPRDEDGQVVDAVVEWTSSDPAVVDVDQNGLLAAVGAGSATITVSAEGVERTIEATVAEPPPDEPVEPPGPAPRPAVAALALRLADSGEAVGSGLQLNEGSSLALRAEPRSSAGGPIGGVSVSWNSSNPAIAYVDAAGVLRAPTSGDVTIAATAEGVTETFRVSVVMPPPGTLVLTVRPWAFVTIDGVRRGEDQTRLELSLAAGPHALSLEHPALGTFDTTIVIGSNQETRVDKLLSPGGG